MSAINKQQLMKLVSYFILGDGGVYRQSEKGNAQFIMNMKQENADYIYWVKEVLENITTVKVVERILDNKDGCKRKPQYRLDTRCHPYFNAIRDRIYIDSYKGLDPHTLKLLDAEALAILYMCDGSLKTYKSVGSINWSYDVTLNLKRLSYGDQLLLKKTLKELLDLEWNINRNNQYYYLRLRSKDINKFMELVTPYIKPSFKYKLVCTAPEKGDDIVCSA